MTLEARIESPQPVYIQDLGVWVRPGTHTWVPKEKADSSACLAQLIRLGKVRVSFRKRCKVSKDPPRRPPAIAGALSRPRKAGLQKPIGKQQQIQQAAKEAGMTPEQVADLVQQAAAAAAQQAAAAVVGQLNTAPGIAEVEERLQRTIENALQSRSASQGGGSNAAGPRSAGPDEPVYIPTGIVRDDLDSEVQVQASESQSGGLDAANEALRALRRRKTQEAMRGIKSED